MSPFKDQLSNTDEELLARFLETGNNFFFGELYKRYTHLVLGLCMKYLKDEEQAKDMVMTIFEKLLLKLPSEKVEYFKSWLYIVAKNECLMYLRKSKGSMQLKFSENNYHDVMENDGHAHLNEEHDKEEILKALENGITQLNEGQKVCIELFYLKERSYVEVAQETGYSLNEVKSHIQNGKRNLKSYLSSNE